MKYNRVLSIETSCDDTSVAIVTGDGFVESQVTANQDLQHAAFGGVVPEVAGRNHAENLLPLVDKALEKGQKTWSDIDGIAVTNRPGLVGSLIVGLVTAKTLSLAKNTPFIGVNHIEGHVWAPFLSDETYQGPKWSEPFLSLAISGGHTRLILVSELGQYKILGSSIDDAAGEAFDKFAKVLGLGYPGGVEVDRFAAKGDSSAYDFPRPMMKEKNYKFSFSGLKTSALKVLEPMSQDEKRQKVADLCASYQKAIVDVLLHKLFKAAEEYDCRKISITGGVSANSEIRKRAQKICDEKGYELSIPPLKYCTDNAAMIGLVGMMRLNQGETSGQDLPPSPKSLESDFQ